MWATLALATALNLAPAQSGTLQLKNDRVTYGELGQERKDSKLLPGDILVVAYDIEGLKVADDGKVQYSMSLDLLNKDGKSQFKQEPSDMEAINGLGGNIVPAFAHVTIGADQPPGEYTLKVTVKDRSTGKSDTLSRKFEVQPAKFGFVRIGLSYLYPNTNVYPSAPPLAVPGQTFFVNFTATGFDLDKSRKDQPHIESTFRVLDEAGKPVLAKPFLGSVTEVPPEYKKFIPMQFILSVNRTGKFKLELTATDKVSGKTATQTLDLTVVEAK